MRRYFVTCLAALLVSVAIGRIRLPHLIGDNMVLQQQTEARLWGWSAPGGTVTVTTSWGGGAVVARVGNDGRWWAKVRTPEASMVPRTVTVSDADGSVTLNDVLIGDVWV